MIAPPHLVVGYDGTQLSEAALRRAVLLSGGHRFSLIHVVCVAQRVDEQVKLPSGERMHAWMAAETLRHFVQACSRDWKISRRKVRIITHLIVGDPAEALVEFSYRNHATQIVLGSRAKIEDHTKVGHVAERVLSLSDIPVHLETPWATTRRENEDDAIAAWGTRLNGQTLFGPRLPPWRNPALA